MSQAERRTDRIAVYLKKHNTGILFDELSVDYLRRAHVDDILTDVPVPIATGLGDELSTVSIAFGMAQVVGADTEFRYRSAYLAYLKRLFGEDAVKAILSEGAKAAGSGNYELACAFFRAALLLEPESQDALYLYGRACKDAYETETEDEDYVGNFKAESLETFELLTMLFPKFAMGYYFLGYGYANLGLYLKAQLTWEEFLSLTAAEADEEVGELREEVQERLDSLAEPVRLEQGVNAVLSGDYQGGRDLLTPYTKGRYETWWPLWYYLAVASSAMGEAEEAIRCYRQALVYSPSNLEVMGELAAVYDAVGDAEGAQKYRAKMEVVRQNLILEQE